MYTKQEIIIRYLREGKSQREISRVLQISRKTVKKYIEGYFSSQKKQVREKKISMNICRSALSTTVQNVRSEP
jgi:transposase